MSENATLRVRHAAVPTGLDALIIAIGYEERSRLVGERLASASDRRIAFAFGSEGIGSYNRNFDAAQAGGFDIIPMADSFAETFADLLRALPAGGAHIGVDISSFTKFHLAEIVDSLRSHASGPVEVDFLYAPASSEQWEVRSTPIRIAEPVHPSFASWVDDPSEPLTAIIGLGVEDNLGLGVAEHLDVSAVYAFSPTGSDPGFDELGAEANQEFFMASYVVRRAEYDLLEPFDLFTRLESLVYGLNAQSRVAIIPLGPKIFALCALLAAALSARPTTVWRFSGGDADEPKDVKANGEIVTLRVSTTPTIGSLRSDAY